MTMAQRELLTAARSFNAVETTAMRDAYALASAAFRVMHRTNADLETKLASIVLFVYASEKVAHPARRVDVRLLAEESLDTLIRFSNAECRPFGCSD